VTIANARARDTQVTGERIRFRGLVQGVGFRPTVWRIARELGLQGDVRNDGEGVLVHAWGEMASLEEFCVRLREQCPPLARIDALERTPLESAPETGGFRIFPSQDSQIRTAVVPDAATCEACRREIFDPGDRRFRYPFTNCTHCGPRLTIVHRVPYDRANTSMAVFPMCPTCRAEYEDPADRRFHAQPNACPACGPRVWLEDPSGRPVEPTDLGRTDALDAASVLMARGHILAIKGIGGFHLACDASDTEAVERLRLRKHRFRKPFALMARDMNQLRRYVSVGAAEAKLLQSPAAPIVLLERRPDAPPLAPGIAPGQATLGFMLPYSPLHHLLLSDWDQPLVMTSGNLSDEPQCTRNQEAGMRLGAVADYLLLHDREIVSRVDDSVIRFMDSTPRFLRRGRGYAPSPLPLPEGLAAAPPLLALGGELKSTLCLVRDGQATLSQHLGDLEEARTADAYQQAIALYGDILQLVPEQLVVDAHPDYHSTRIGRAWATREGIPLGTVQHHHAHIASVLAENAWPMDAGRVLGIALDGLGYGLDGSLWGAELLLADYRDFERVGHLAPTPMPGGTKAILEPWRNTWAHLATHIGWDRILERWRGLELIAWLQGQPLDMLATMAERSLNSPLASSAGRLFDAVAAALGIDRQSVTYEGQAAIELEALAARASRITGTYPFALRSAQDLLQLDPGPMWEALLDDLVTGEPLERIAARFHQGLAAGVVEMATQLAQAQVTDTVALSGGVFQNRLLFEATAQGLRRAGVQVLTHRLVPTNDGGLSLGQAAVACARIQHP
jgi:hydrogenase maturation protein HypF